MDILKEISNELGSEYQTTRRFFERFPDGENDYKPHEKSTSLIHLVTHIADIFAWPQIILRTDKLDFAANEYKPASAGSREELLTLLENNFTKGNKAVEGAAMEDLDGRWSINQGDTVIMEWSKYGALRHALNQITHHRAQLGVYYRLLDIPVPASYGPSADERTFSSGGGAPAR